VEQPDGGLVPSLLEAEIRQQPEILAHRSEAGRDPALEAARLLSGPDVTHLLIAARGSSDNAARYGQYLFGQHLRLATHLATPSLYADGVGPAMTGSVVMGISQSGQSPDVVGVVKAGRTQGRPTIALTNDPRSPLAAAAELVVPLLAGPERSVAATKTYLATLHALVQIAAAAGADRLEPGLHEVPELVGEAIDHALSRAVGSTLAARPVTCVGRGTGFATAAESALKIREVAAIRAEAYPVPDLLHGPVAANGPDSCVWMVASPSYPAAYWDGVAAPLSRAGVHVTALVEAGSPALTAQTRWELPAGLPAWLFDFVAVVYGQVAALHLGEAAGLDVDHPHGLRKITRTD
jgi:glucosamine--fructose-6-phosphate aminotransferase (isomerizing)